MKLIEIKRGKVKIKEVKGRMKERFISVGILEGSIVEVIRNDGEIVVIKAVDKVFGMDKNTAELVEVNGV